METSPFSLTRPGKRARLANPALSPASPTLGGEPSLPLSPLSGVANDSPLTEQKAEKKRGAESAFADIPSTVEPTLAALDARLPRKLAKKAAAGAGNPATLLFSLAEVQTVVRTALVAQEATLRESYDSVLAERLEDQQAVFQNYCRDWMERQEEERGGSEAPSYIS